MCFCSHGEEKEKARKAAIDVMENESTESIGPASTGTEVGGRVYWRIESRFKENTNHILIIGDKSTTQSLTE